MTAEVKFLKDSYPGAYSNGLTMLGSGTMNRFSVIDDNDKETILETENGVRLVSSHIYSIETDTTESITTIENNSDETYTMEMITSFLVKGIKADKVHRMLSFWSAEGRLKTDSLVELNMEVSWAKHGIRVEKFGSVGSMPVRSYFPFVALEDSENSDFTAVSLYTPSSWQMEIVCQRDENYILAGGIADRDFGQWTKILKPGDRFIAPKAVIAHGKSLLEVCNKLLDAQKPAISPVDNEMGITFNEYCTTWGNPTIDNLKKICDKLEGKGIQYLVMDSGWYLKEGEYWWDHIGKWEVNKERFPKGLKELTQYVRSKGMIPGIWFEPESMAKGAEIFNKPEYLLKKDGVPLDVAGKRFLDMESKPARDFLRERVIGLLKDNDFGYIKIDYNDSIGMGCDDPEGPGEGLRRKLLASQDFFRELCREIPGLVIENCSSGGHRLEPSMMELASMASFSDAHETLSIPLIAANLLRLVRAEQNQIWAVLRAGDSDARLYYSLCATLMGRMGLSGDIYDLSDHQWELVNEGISFYKKASDIIKNGRTVEIETDAVKYNDPTGHQLVIREYNGARLVIFHKFKGDAVKEEDIFERALTEGLSVAASYGDLTDDYSAKAWILK